MFDGMKKTSSEIEIPLKIKMEDNRRRQKVNRTWDDKEDTDAVSVHEGGQSPSSRELKPLTDHQSDLEREADVPRRS